MDSPPAYDADGYWSARLDKDFNLRGTGHLAYSEKYNKWLYRAKQRALNRALAGLPTNGRALDVGSGVGWVVQQLRDHGYDVDGCDISESAVARLTERHPGSAFFVLTLGVTEIPRPQASYAVATALDVAYHVTDDEQWRAGLADIARVLVPGGHLIVTDVLGDEVDMPAPHVRFRTRDLWLDAARSAGLELDRSGVLYRWLSRDPHTTRLSQLPDGMHGAVAFTLDRLTRRSPQMRWARFRRRS